MPSPPLPPLRVIVRLPYNRPEDAPADPPRLEWNADKEHILWEVIAKSRAIEGAGTDWKGLAAHLQVPLPYLLYRAQVRYEEDLRGLQGLGARSPLTAFPSAPSPISPQRTNGPTPGEYFPRVPDPIPPHEPSRMGSSSSATGVGTSASGTSTLRPILGVRARLSSLGHAQGRALQAARSPSSAHPHPHPSHVQSPLSAQPHPGEAFPLPPVRPAKKVSSSSTLTLQGPAIRRRSSAALQRLSPASSRAGSSSEGGDDGDMSDSDDESDEETRRAEETERQDALARKLQDLERLMTRDTLGLVADRSAQTPVQNPAVNGNGSGSGPRGRPRPLSGSTSLSASMHQRRMSPSRSQSHQSMSSASVDSPQGSIPSIPSPTNGSPHYTPEQQQQQPRQQLAYPRPPTHTRHLSHGHIAPPSFTPYHTSARSTSQSQSLSSHSFSNSRPSSAPQSPHRVTSPAPVPVPSAGAGARRLGTPEKSASPPALSQTHAVRRAGYRTGSALAVGTPTGSEASSFSDLSDVSQSALESALASNIRTGGSRASSFGRSHLPSKRSSRG